MRGLLLAQASLSPRLQLNLSSGWVVGLEKESKSATMVVMGSPAMTVLVKEAEPKAASVGAGSTAIWKAPLWRVWVLVREEVLVCKLCSREYYSGCEGALEQLVGAVVHHDVALSWRG